MGSIRIRIRVLAIPDQITQRKKRFEGITPLNNGADFGSYDGGEKQ
jgi:hypothetical protein